MIEALVVLALVGFGLLGAVLRVLFSGAGIVLGLFAVLLVLLLLPLLPLLVLGLGLWVLARAFCRPAFVRT